MEYCVQSKQSSDVSAIYGRSESFTAPFPIHALAPGLPGPIALRGGPSAYGAGHGPQVAQNEGLLHDARNLMGAIGLYCDLLSMPGVLYPEHHHYAEELRLLGSRSGALIERLIQSWHVQGGPQGLAASATRQAGDARSLRLVGVRPVEAEPAGNQVGPASTSQPVRLQEIVMQCSGLLSRVANGHAIEISYGPAASVPVLVDEEAVERILVNLVRNSAAAMIASVQTAHPHEDGIARDAHSAILERTADGTADETPGAIRIGVGVVSHRLDGPRPQPLRRVRLTVEDSGCGMAPDQLERVLGGVRESSRDSHGIGFIVVRELVAASSGDLRVMSAPGVGTRVQIEWPATEGSCVDAAQKNSNPSEAAASNQLAAAYWLPRPERARLRLHAQEGPRGPEDPRATAGPRAVEVGAIDGSHGDRGAENREWTSC
jgi:signal transduction histidine kinase